MNHFPCSCTQRSFCKVWEQSCCFDVCRSVDLDAAGCLRGEAWQSTRMQDCLALQRKSHGQVRFWPSQWWWGGASGVTTGWALPFFFHRQKFPSYLNSTKTKNSVSFPDLILMSGVTAVTHSFPLLADIRGVFFGGRSGVGGREGGDQGGGGRVTPMWMVLKNPYLYSKGSSEKRSSLRV